MNGLCGGKHPMCSRLHVVHSFLRMDTLKDIFPYSHCSSYEQSFTLLLKVLLFLSFRSYFLIFQFQPHTVDIFFLIHTLFFSTPHNAEHEKLRKTCNINSIYTLYWKQFPHQCFMLVSFCFVCTVSYTSVQVFCLFRTHSLHSLFSLCMLVSVLHKKDR